MGMFAQAAREMRGYRLTEFSPQSTAYWVAKLFGGGYQSSTGIAVTPEIALTIPAVYSAIRNLAEDQASLPLPVYKDNAITAGTSMAAAMGAPKVIDRSAPAYAVLNKMGNPEMSAMVLRETLHGHEYLRGDGFAEIDRDQGLRLKALWPLNPARMRMARNGQNGLTVSGAPPNALFYLYTLPNGQEKVFSSDLIFHPHGFGPDGMRGYSIVALLRESMGMALAIEQFGGRFFSNDATPGMVLTHPKTLGDKARTNIETSWRETHQGLDNAHRIAILEEGLSVEKIGMDNVDAQFLETAKLKRDDFLMVLRMPPDKAGNFDRATYSNMEQSDLNYIKWTLRARGRRFEQQLSADNVVDASHYALHDYSDLNVGDMAARASFYHSLRQDGAINGADIRRFENLDPSDDAGVDQMWVPMNVIPAAAIRPDGTNVYQLSAAALNLLKGGYEPDAVNTFLGLGDLAHTGLMPGKATPAAGEAEGDGSSSSDGSTDASTTTTDTGSV